MPRSGGRFEQLDGAVWIAGCEPGIAFGGYLAIAWQMGLNRPRAGLDLGNPSGSAGIDKCRRVGEIAYDAYRACFDVAVCEGEAETGGADGGSRPAASAFE